MTSSCPITRSKKELNLTWNMGSQDAGAYETYPAFRRAKFDQFLAGVLSDLPENVCRTWEAKVRAAEAEDLPAYQRQMSILAYLEPGIYGETRVPISVQQAHIGVLCEEHCVDSSAGERACGRLPRTISPPKRQCSLKFRELNIRPDRTCFAIA